MAIPTGSGTEGLRNALFYDLGNQNQILIQGVRYHIYTVLSVTVYNARTNGASANKPTFVVQGYSQRGSLTQESIKIFNVPILAQDETYVFNDKFSFYGAESDVTQGTTTTQQFRVSGGHTADSFDICVTWIDQDWT